MKRNDTLKIIAMLSMFIDHMGIILFPQVIFFRTIGRIAFPIFAFHLAKGYRLTSNRSRYQQRLLLFGLISQVPYIFLDYDLSMNIFHFNVILYFLYATFILQILDIYKSNRKVHHLIALIILILLPGVLEIMFSSFGFSYSTYGILMIIIFYLFDQQWNKVLILYILLSVLDTYITGAVSIYSVTSSSFLSILLNVPLVWTNISYGLLSYSGYFFQMRSILALPFIFIGDFLHGPRLNKWISYVFYPAHISLLLLIRVILGGPIG